MKIGIFHATAGYGHTTAAKSLAKDLLHSGFSADDVFIEDSLDSTPNSFKKFYPGSYYFMVKHCPSFWGWCYEVLDMPEVYRLVKPLRSLVNRIYGRKLLKRMIEMQPDVLISTHFFTAQLFARAKRKGKLKSKLITVVTDFYPHSFWMNSGTDLYCIMSEEGAQNLKSRGVLSNQINASGIPIDRAFRQAMNREDSLKKHGFDPGRLTLFLTSGSFGLGHHELILSELGRFRDDVQCFIGCGHNQEAFQHLTAQKYPFPVKVFGFIDFMPELMAASDLIVAKPGGATTSESLAMNLPMIIFNPIPGQELRNADLLRARGLSFFIKHPHDVLGIIERIQQTPELLDQTRNSIRAFAKPHASTEIVELIKAAVSND